MLEFTITTVSLGGQRRNEIVSVAIRTPFKGVLNQARSQGLTFGFGRLSINGIPILPEKMVETVNGRVTKNGTVMFEERARTQLRTHSDADVVDIESLLGACPEPRR